MIVNSTAGRVYTVSVSAVPGVTTLQWIPEAHGDESPSVKKSNLNLKAYYVSGMFTNPDAKH